MICFVRSASKRKDEYNDRKTKQKQYWNPDDFGFIIGAGVGVVLFPDKMAVGAGIGMCVGIFLAAMTQILTRNKQETD
jgi:hypothetical protein